MLGGVVEKSAAVRKWTADDVEERLVEAFEFQHRTVRLGHGRLRATDGPWHLVIRDTNAARQDADNLADYQPETDVDREARGRGGLRAAEVDRMEEALGWCALLPAGEVRKLVGVVMDMTVRPGAGGGPYVWWVEVRRRLGSARSPDALRVRYRRALIAIARHLSGASTSRKPLI